MESQLKRIAAMKSIATLLAVAAFTLAANSADAKGCLKGAFVGGVAGATMPAITACSARPPAASTAATTPRSRSG